MSGDQLEALAPFTDVLRDPARVATAWKERGRKVIGTRCLFVPEEMIWAAGMLPYPVYGTPEPIRQADAYFQSCSCEFARNLFDHALDGSLGFLDGMVLANTCDALRKLYDMWGHYVAGVPIYLINQPQKLLDPTNHDYFTEELRRFRSWVEGHGGSAISDESLREAIALFNHTRRLLRAVYDLRRADPPRLSGEEAFTVAMAASILPRDRANPLLERLLDELRQREAPERDGPRLMVTGSLLDTPVLIKMIEEEGGLVVADDLCTTSRGFWRLVDEDGDPIEALWRYHNNRPLCACMHPFEGRLAHITGMAEEFGVEAVINFDLKYCHPSLYETPLVRKELEARGLAVNVLEVGHDLSGHGQLRTRIQAFIEMLSL